MTEKKHHEVQASLQRKLAGYGSLGSDLELIRQEAGEYLDYLASVGVDTAVAGSLGGDMEELTARLDHIQVDIVENIQVKYGYSMKEVKL